MWKRYRRRGIVEARPYVKDEPLVGISVSHQDIPREGGMIVRSPEKLEHQVYMNPTYFNKHYEEVEGECLE